MKKLLFTLSLLLCSLFVFSQGVIDNANSSNTPLDSAAVFTGQWADVSDYASVRVGYTSNVIPSNVELQFSPNKSDVVKSWNYSRDSVDVHVVETASQFFRLIYTNDTIAQTRFDLETHYHETREGIGADVDTVALAGGVSVTLPDTLDVSLVSSSDTLNVFVENKSAIDVNAINTITTTTQDTVVTVDGTVSITASSPLDVSISGPDPLPTRVQFPNGNLDAFGQFRVSNPVTLFDSKLIIEQDTLFWDDEEISGGGTSSNYSADLAGGQLVVSNLTAGRRVRQTKQRFNYQPGKSQKILITGALDPTGGGSGNNRCLGYYDDDNGVNFTMRNDSVFVVIRSYTSGSAVDTEIYQEDWNIDPMDGSGDSGVTINWTRVQIFFFDLEWLGVGSVRFGLVVDGALYYIHKQNHANSNTTVYMSTPNLPIRYEIENDGTGGAATLGYICSTVISEGGQQETGLVRYASTGGTHVDANTENLIYAVVGIRLKAGSHVQRAIRLLRATLMLTSTGDEAEWLLIFNPTVAGTFTYSDQAASSVQIATGATANTVTGGFQIDGGFLESSGGFAASAGSAGEDINNSLKLGSYIDGTVDEIVLCVRPIGGSTNLDVEGSIKWIEER